MQTELSQVERERREYRALAIELLDVARTHAYWHVRWKRAGAYRTIRDAEKVLGLPESDMLKRVDENLET